MRAWKLAALAVGILLVAAACPDDVDDPALPEDTPDAPAPAEPTPFDDVGSDAWTTLAAAPVELTELDAAAFGGELWTVGGFTAQGGVTTSVFIYDPQADAWREGPEFPEPLHHAALIATDTTLVVVGGYRGRTFDPIADVFILDAEQETWTPGPSLPEPRGAGAAAWDGERIVYGGGIGPGGLAGEVWALEGLDGEWADVGRLSVPRDHLDATSDGEGTVWFLAGRLASLDANLGTVDLVRGDDIREIGELPTPRGGVAAFFSEAYGACLAGGEEDDATFDEVECIDADGETTVLPPLSHPRHGLGADTIDGIAYVALGGPEPRLTVSNTLEALRVDGSGG